MDKQATIKSTNMIVNGVIIYLLTSVVAVVMATIAVIGAVASDNVGGLIAGGLTGTVIVSLLSIVGLVLYLVGLKGFGAQLDEIGKSGMGLALIAAILTVVGILIETCIPIGGGMISGVVLIVSAILYYMGFNKLKISTSLNELGQAGAKTLVTASIFLLISEVLDYIIFLKWAAGILAILYYIFFFIGWSKVRKSFKA